MIDDQTKKALLAELAKSGNVYYACAKTNVSRATYYRWRNEDKLLRTASDKALRHGRSNMVDIAEQALMQKVKEKDLGAIKYLLAHNSKTYGPSRKPTEVVLRHVREDQRTSKNNGEDPADKFFNRLERELTPEEDEMISRALKYSGAFAYKPDDKPADKPDEPQEKAK